MSGHFITTEAKLKKARSLLISREPWYGHAAMALHWRSAPGVGTMGVRIVRGGEVECVYEPAFVDRLSVEELFAAVQHEVEHVIRCHCIRSGGRDRMRWNIACDMCVNGPPGEPRIGYLEVPGRGLIIPDRDHLVWIPPSWPSDESAEWYYNMLGGMADGVLSGEVFDNHDLWDQSDVSSAEAAAVAQAIAVEATERSSGRVPKHLAPLVRRPDPPNLTWKTLLRRYLLAAVTSHRPSWMRRSRRHDQFGMPGRIPQRTGRVSVIVDTSGSVSDQLLGQFFGEIESICRHARVCLLLWDDHFEGFFPNYQAGDWKKVPLAGRGGTDMAAPVEWLVQEKQAGDCIVMLTDGYCNWPDPQRVSLVVVLPCRTSGVEPPVWAKAVYLDS